MRLRPPNILLITCHDLGRHIGCYGVETVQTPNLDALASEGVRFSNFFSTSAVCSPGRASLHTGRYPQSNGVMGLLHAPWWWQLNTDEKHTAQLLAEHGYTTHLIGFNHVHKSFARLGYDEALSVHAQAPESVKCATELIETSTSAERPFFAKVGFREVHRRFMHGKDEERGVFVPPWMKDTPDIRADLAEFQATIKYFDERVGEILGALASSPVAEQTLIVMTSDHGIPYPGAKWTARKAGIEVPLILFQPGTVFSGGKVFAQLMSNVDVLPTLLDYGGAEVPQNVQGRSYMDLIRGKTDASPRREVFAQYTPEMKRDNLSRSILTERHHLIRYFDPGREVDYPVDVHPQEFANHTRRCRTRGTRPFAQLYDLEADPYELNDIGAAKENASTVADLSQRLLAWMREVEDPLLNGPLRTPYYDLAMADCLGQNSSAPRCCD